MKSKIKRLYVYQVENKNLKEATNHLEDVLNNTERNVEKGIYQYYDYTVMYSVPLFDGNIRIFPVDTSFVESMLPARYTTNDFPDKQRKTMNNLNSRAVIGDRASFLIELPDGMASKDMEYIIKILGLSFGGYFSPLLRLPRHGVLTKKKHIYVDRYESCNEDLIDTLEDILEKQNSRLRQIENRKN